MQKHWFTSDLHFGHKNILKFCADSRKFETVEDMNEAIIARWNEQVSPDDIVYILGDVFFCDAGKASKILERLPGTKHLIWGNHDQVIRNTPAVRSHFVSASDYKVITVEKKKVVLFHYPIWEWDKMHYGSYHLFGHVHNNTSVPGRAMDVGIDTRTDAGLWSWEEIDSKLGSIEVRPHH